MPPRILVNRHSVYEPVIRAGQRQECPILTTLSVSESVGRSVSESFSQSFSQSVSRSVNQWVGQSVSESVGQSVSESGSQRISQPVSQQINEPVNQQVGRSVGQWTSQPFIRLSSHSFTRSFSQSVNQAVNRSVSQPANQTFTHSRIRILTFSQEYDKERERLVGSSRIHGQVSCLSYVTMRDTANNTSNATIRNDKTTIHHLIIFSKLKCVIGFWYRLEGHSREQILYWKLCSPLSFTIWSWHEQFFYLFFFYELSCYELWLGPKLRGKRRNSSLSSLPFVQFCDTVIVIRCPMKDRRL